MRGAVGRSQGERPSLSEVQVILNRRRVRSVRFRGTAPVSALYFCMARVKTTVIGTSARIARPISRHRPPIRLAGANSVNTGRSGAQKTRMAFDVLSDPKNRPTTKGRTTRRSPRRWCLSDRPTPERQTKSPPLPLVRPRAENPTVHPKRTPTALRPRRPWPPRPRALTRSIDPDSGRLGG